MKIDKKIKKEAEKLVDKFIKSHEEKDEVGKLTGINPILEVLPSNLKVFMESDEYRQVDKIPTPITVRRPTQIREFRKKLRTHAKHYFKSKMDFKSYNEEFEDDPSIMVENWKEYIKLIKQEE